MNDSQSRSPASFLQIMRALLAKDCRLFRAPMIALLVVGPGCFIVGFAAVSFEPVQGNLLNRVLESLFGASMVACMLTSLSASAFGGISIAGERTDRTADFLAMLPVTPAQIILSKWIASLLLLLGFAIFYALVASVSFYIGTTHERGAPPTIGDFDTSQAAANIACWIGFTISLFGIAWLLSTFLKSGPISACISIAVTLAAAAALGLALHGTHHRDQDVTLLFSILTLAIGLSSAIGGAIYYRRRIAP